jgi:hypothetical protein
VLQGEPDLLLIDLSPAPPPDGAEVRAWADSQSVFVSSVMAGMSAEREAVMSAITTVGARPVLFEGFGGMDDDPEEAFLGNVASSDIYVGILGSRYGKPLKSGYSATHAEYSEAVRRGLRISVWSALEGLDGRQRDFLEEVRVFQTTGTYTSPEELAERFERRLRVIAAESLAPWVKIGNAVCRATSVNDDGQRVIVTARVRDSTVAANIEARRPSSAYGRHSETRITWPGGTARVRVTAVTTEMSSSRVKTVTVTAARLPEDHSNLLEVGLEGRSPEDLTELAMRIALLGESNPLGLMSFMATAADPLRALEGLAVSEDAFAQIAELLISEELVGVRRVDHISAFRLGPIRGGRRHLLLGWFPRSRYVNVEPTERRIEGDTIRRSS